MRVVDHAEERLLFGGGCQQAQCSTEDGQPVGDLVGAERERGSERDRLGVRKGVEQQQYGLQELVQARKRDVYFGFDASRAKDAHVSCPRDSCIEEGAFPDSRLAAEDERRAPAAPRRVEHLVEAGGLELPANEHLRRAYSRSSKTLGISPARTRAGGGDDLEDVMRPIVFSLQFRGRARSIRSDRLRCTLSAPSSALVTTVGPGGISSAFEDVPGAEARLEAELSFGGRTTFDDIGTIDFGRGHALRFRSIGIGRLTESPDPNLKQGAVVREVEGGAGQFAGAEGHHLQLLHQRHGRSDRQPPRLDLRPRTAC
jgi:hypothetical protein